jgi:hypothetical protein
MLYSSAACVCVGPFEFVVSKICWVAASLLLHVLLLLLLHLLLLLPPPLTAVVARSNIHTYILVLVGWFAHSGWCVLSVCRSAAVSFGLTPVCDVKYTFFPSDMYLVLGLLQPLCTAYCFVMIMICLVVAATLPQQFVPSFKTTHTQCYTLQFMLCNLVPCLL